MWGWNAEALSPGFRRHGTEPTNTNTPDETVASVEKFGNKVRKADAVVKDNRFWSYMVMLDVQCDALLELIRWTESCACHWRFVVNGVDHLSAKMRHAIARCPFRGQRCAEISAGDFIEVFGKFRDCSLCELLGKVDGEDEVWIHILVLEFDKGRLCLLCTFALKLENEQEPPWCAHAMNHPLARKRVIAVKKVRWYVDNARYVHPLLKPLKQGPARDQLDVWYLQQNCEYPDINGQLDAFEDMPALAEVLCTFKMNKKAERYLERPHAFSLRQVRKSPNHGEAVISMTHRWSPMVRRFEKCPETKAEIAS